MLQMRDVGFAYPGGQVIDYPDVTLSGGEQVLVLGPSGSGKSTLLALWSGQLSPKRGTVTVGGQDLARLRGAARDRWRGRHVGLVYQAPRLIASQTVRANVELPSRLIGRPVERARTDAALAGLGIAHVADRLPERCSLGEQQRAAILRAIYHAPALILADEPTSALDAANAAAVADLLAREAARTGAALAIVTHDERLRARFARTIALEPRAANPDAA